MEPEETTHLLDNNKSKGVGLTTFYAIVCIVDVFGVFPLVSLPKSIIDCGLSGILIVAVVSTLQIYTAILLGKCWLLAEKIEENIEEKNRYPYAALVEITYGSKVSKLVTVLLDITVFTGSIPNLLVAAQTLQLLTTRLSNDSFTLSSCYWIIIIGVILCPLLWFGSPKDMKMVCTLSVIMVVGLFLSIISVMIFYTNRIPVTTKNSKPLWQNLLMAFGILTFQFDIHPTILTVQMDMQKKEEIGKAVIGGFSATLSMFIIVTTSAYFTFGDQIYPSLLGNLASSTWLHFSAFLVAAQLGLTCVVSNSALYLHIEDILGISRDFNHKRCIIRSSLTIFAIVIAESVPKLDIVMSLIGGALIAPLVFIFPPLIYLKMKAIKKRRDSDIQLETPEDGRTNKTNLSRLLETIFCCVIICVGILGMFSGTYINVKNAIEYTTFSQPCIYNLTSALSI